VRTVVQTLREAAVSSNPFAGPWHRASRLLTAEEVKANRAYFEKFTKLWSYKSICKLANDSPYWLFKQRLVEEIMSDGHDPIIALDAARKSDQMPVVEFFSRAWTTLTDAQREGLARELHQKILSNLQQPATSTAVKNLLEPFLRRMIEQAIETMTPEIYAHCHRWIQERWEQQVEKVANEALQRALLKVKTELSR
jgi:hypothetical protein